MATAALNETLINPHHVFLNGLLEGFQVIDDENSDKFFFLQRQHSALHRLLNDKQTGYEDFKNRYKQDAHKLLESLGEDVMYSSGQYLNGTAFPHELIEEGISTGTVSSHSSPESINEIYTYKKAIQAMKALYDRNGSLISDKLLKFRPHLQSLFLASNPYPILGLNAAILAALSYLNEADGNPPSSNVWKVAENEQPDGFSVNCVFHADISQLTHVNYINNYCAYCHPIDDDEDYLGDYDFGGIFIYTVLEPISQKQISNFFTTIAQVPFKFIKLQNVPNNLISTLLEHYYNDIDYACFVETCQNYHDVFAYMLACASGLSLNYFKAYIGKDSGFFRLTEDEQIQVLVQIKSLVDPIAIAMQDGAFQNNFAHQNMGDA